MRGRVFARGWRLIGCAVLIAPPSSAVAAAPEEVRAGAAFVRFELPPRVPLAGYSRREGKPSVGTHDPVGVRAVVLEQGPRVAALVSSDLLIVDEHLAGAVQERLSARGFPGRAVLLLAATHTHSGPGAYGTRFLEKISMGHYDPAVFEAIASAMAEAVLQARGRLVPVRAAAFSAPTQGLAANRMDADGMVDEELRGAALYPPGAEAPSVILVNFSAHPTTLGAWNRWISGDYPGVMTAALERRFPGAVCLFFAGSVGDQAPVKAGIGFERAQWIGRALAQQVEHALSRAVPAVPGVLEGRQERFVLPPARVRLGARISLPRWIGARLVDDDATVSVLRLGPVVFFGVPCDLASDLGRRLMSASRAEGVSPFIVGFANDYIGYCVSASRYRAAQYEALMAFNGPAAGELVVERLLQLFSQISD